MGLNDAQTLVQLLIANPVLGIFVVIILLGTGGGGAALIQSRTARRLGIQGNALAKDKTSIDGFIGLTSIQETTITRQERTIEAQGKTIEEQGEQIGTLQSDVRELMARVDSLDREYRKEIDYSNALEEDRLRNGLVPMPRPE